MYSTRYSHRTLSDHTAPTVRLSCLVAMYSAPVARMTLYVHGIIVVTKKGYVLKLLHRPFARRQVTCDLVSRGNRTACGIIVKSGPGETANAWWVTWQCGQQILTRRERTRLHQESHTKGLFTDAGS